MRGGCGGVDSGARFNLFGPPSFSSLPLLFSSSFCPLLLSFLLLHSLHSLPLQLFLIPRLDLDLEFFGKIFFFFFFFYSFVIRKSIVLRFG